MEALKHNFLLRGFFLLKNRGCYEDASDLTETCHCESSPGRTRKVFEYDGQKIFNEQAKLKDEKTLKEAGDYLQTNKFSLAVVAVSTGMKGETEKDRVLSEGRAAVVRDYLAKNYRLDDTRIKTLGLGKASDTGQNGKAEILVYAGPTPAGATPPTQSRRQTP